MKLRAFTFFMCCMHIINVYTAAPSAQPEATGFDQKKRLSLISEVFPSDSGFQNVLFDWPALECIAQSDPMTKLLLDANIVQEKAFNNHQENKHWLLAMLFTLNDTLTGLLKKKSTVAINPHDLPPLFEIDQTSPSPLKSVSSPNSLSPVAPLSPLASSSSASE